MSMTDYADALVFLRSQGTVMHLDCAKAIETLVEENEWLFSLVDGADQDILERLLKAERERDLAKNFAIEARRQADQAERERDEARAERDKWKDDAAWDKNAARDFLGRAEAAEAEVARLKAAITKFISVADAAPKRTIGSGIGGQTMEATLKRAGRLVSEWQLGQLEEALEAKHD